LLGGSKGGCWGDEMDSHSNTLKKKGGEIGSIEMRKKKKQLKKLPGETEEKEERIKRL